MSLLLKQCLCSTKWNNIESSIDTLKSESSIDTLNSESLFKLYFKLAYENGWRYYRLYPKQFNLIPHITNSMYYPRNSDTIIIPFWQRLYHMQCSICTKKNNGFLQISCDPSICNLTKKGCHVINICHNCVESNTCTIPACLQRRFYGYI